MRQFNIKVSKCDECIHKDRNDQVGGYCSIVFGKALTPSEIYQQNKNGLTLSCPMWDQTVEVVE